MMYVQWTKKVFEIICAQIPEEEKKQKFLALKNEYHAFSKEEKVKIRALMKAELKVDTALYVYSFFMNYMDIDWVSQEIYDCIVRGSFDCLVGIMIEFQLQDKSPYGEERKLHRLNMQRLEGYLYTDYPYIPVQERDQKRIVIIAGQLLGLLHAPTKVILNYAYIMQEHLGYEIIIYVCPSDMHLPNGLWHRACTENTLDVYNDVSRKQVFNGMSFRVHQINMTDENVWKEYGMMLDLIYAQKPLFVWNVANNPVADLCSRFTTVAAMGMSTASPISEGQILLRIARESREAEQQYEDALVSGQRQLFMEGNAPVIPEEAQNHYTREEYNLPEDRFLITIVGNRLDDEVDEEFLETVFVLLKEISQIDIVVIGQVEQIKEAFDAGGWSGRVHYLGYCKDLAGVYEILDLYVNPKRKGGGFSAGMALASALPVVTLPDCDVAYNCGDEFVVGSMAELAEAVRRYATDAGFYEGKQKSARERAKQYSYENLVSYVTKLVHSVEEMIAK